MHCLYAGLAFLFWSAYTTPKPKFDFWEAGARQVAPDREWSRGALDSSGILIGNVWPGESRRLVGGITIERVRLYAGDGSGTRVRLGP